MCLYALLQKAILIDFTYVYSLEVKEHSCIVVILVSLTVIIPQKNFINMYYKKHIRIWTESVPMTQSDKKSRPLKRNYAGSRQIVRGGRKNEERIQGTREKA